MIPEFGSVGCGGLVIVGWNPGADRLPRRFDGLKGFNIEGSVRRWREADKALPETEEAEEKFDIFGADNVFDAAQKLRATPVIFPPGERTGTALLEKSRVLRVTMQ